MAVWWDPGLWWQGWSIMVRVVVVKPDPFDRFRSLFPVRCPAVDLVPPDVTLTDALTMLEYARSVGVKPKSFDIVSPYAGR